MKNSLGVCDNCIKRDVCKYKDATLKYIQQINQLTEQESEYSHLYSNTSCAFFYKDNSPNISLR